MTYLKPIEDLPQEVVPPVPALVAEPAAGGERIRTYEELDGAEGREVFFRLHRYTAADLAPLRCTVTVRLERADHECELCDVSESGVAFTWPPELAAPARGERVRLVVRFDHHELWRGTARVTSGRERDGVVGASFENGLLDTDALLHLRHVSLWGAGASLRAAEKAWHAPGHHEFKALVSELRLLLEDARGRLDELEEGLPWHVLQDPDSVARAALVRRLSAELGAEVRRFAAEIDAARRAAGPQAEEALKAFSLRHVQHFLMESPWMHRARHKPFGYPGDYELMNFFYEKDFEGPSLFVRALGHALIKIPVGLAVTYRKDMMKRQIRALLEARAGSAQPVRILSIAAGPARELQDLLAELEDLPAPLEIVLFDQDQGALSHAYRRLRPLADSRFPGGVRIVFLHESIKRLLRDIRLFDPFGKFDLTYSVGLFDYLQESTAVRLARNLSAAVVPGGPVLIGNMTDHGGRWFMEQHLEWQLIYRTREKLVDIGRRAVPEARIRVLEEQTGVNPFIELVRD